MGADRPNDRPEYRLSDAERQEALDALSEHLGTGRLDIDEFDDRSARAGAAKTRNELGPLFADLPEPQPSVLTSSAPSAPRVHQPEHLRRTTWRETVASSAVPVAAVIAVVLFLTVARGIIYVFLLPAVVALLVSSLSTHRRH